MTRTPGNRARSTGLFAALLLPLPLIVSCGTNRVAGAKAEKKRAAPAKAKAVAKPAFTYPPFVPRKPDLTVGETLTYQVKVGMFAAGEASLTVAAKEKHAGAECYRVEFRTRTNRAFDRIYKVRSHATSWVDVEQGFSRGYVLNEDGRKGVYRKAAAFDYENGKVLFDKTKNSVKRPTLKLDIPGKVQDALSIIYHLRGCALVLDGEAPEFAVSASRKVYKIRAEVLARESMTLPRLKRVFWVLKVRPKGEYPGDGKPKGEMTLWLEEKTRVPVKIVIDIPVITSMSLLLTGTANSPLD